MGLKKYLIRLRALEDLGSIISTHSPQPSVTPVLWDLHTGKHMVQGYICRQISIHTKQIKSIEAGETAQPQRALTAVLEHRQPEFGS